ncbi:hypothetical protein [Streptomyces varsoviensis]|uniref:GlsB/YeaQ/YmgE family stress response membrane protein n=1 Tax=Streptomyces varsoviensis TaxID=67373 RepID=A0ABR5IXV6_9ACTN|nr:hypothetical protein [Streptomyces varsoviensis]KOG85981.1 hypothetical protein ADK38_33555 [Streptomyces varsoviensis]
MNLGIGTYGDLALVAGGLGALYGLAVTREYATIGGGTLAAVLGAGVSLYFGNGLLAAWSAWTLLGLVLVADVALLVVPSAVRRLNR